MYGASFNCRGEEFEIGGGGEGYSSLDYICEDFDRLKERILKDNLGEHVQTNVFTEDHEYVGQNLDDSESVILSVFGFQDDDSFNVVAVLFDDIRVTIVP
jgi:hypothetical protein